MDAKTFKSILKAGETASVEFKRCKEGAKEDTYETICSFLNRFGGDIYLGVEDDGSVSGVPPDSVQNSIENIISMLGNPEVVSPAVHIQPESFEYEGKNIIYIHVPSSSEPHTYKRVYYDRVGSSDVRVKSIGILAPMFMRKLKIHSEETVYPNIRDEDLRFDLFPKIRQMAVNNRPGHPWKHMTDMEIIKSAGLYSEDPETKQWGYNLAAVLLLGKDNVIKRVRSTYCTDALLRRVNVDRYDDRLIVETNLIESYDLLMGFAEKHLLDKFYLEDDVRLSLRNVIAREMIVNTLMHREFLSSHRARFIIEKDKMYTENANLAAGVGEITPSNLTPDSKNPIIAAFFSNIGYSDELGSGTRNLYRYVRRYSGKGPQLIEGDVFMTIVPLDDSYSFDMNTRREPVAADISGLTVAESKVYKVICEGIATTRGEISMVSKVPERSVRRAIASLTERGLIIRIGSDTSGKWIKK